MVVGSCYRTPYINISRYLYLIKWSKEDIKWAIETFTFSDWLFILEDIHVLMWRKLNFVIKFLI